MFEFPREFIFELPMVPVFEFMFDTLTVAIGDGLGDNTAILVLRALALFAFAFMLVVVPPHPSRLPSTNNPIPVPAIFLIKLCPLKDFVPTNRRAFWIRFVQEINPTTEKIGPSSLIYASRSYSTGSGY